MDAKFARVRYGARMKRVVALVSCLAWSSWVGADSLYRENLSFLSDDERTLVLEQLAAIETPSEAQYLTQIALQKPEVFLRQLNRAYDVVRVGGESKVVSDGLRNAGFLGADTQQTLIRFFSEMDAESIVGTQNAVAFVMHLNDQKAVWAHLFEADARDDFNALECAANAAPTELLGPPEHQYVIQVSHPDMELTLWRTDALEAVTYPVAVVAETTVDEYRWVDRFGFDFGTLDRRTLAFTMGENTLVCAKIPAPILRAYQEYQREMVLSDKQL